jgi:hypothetical protein
MFSTKAPQALTSEPSEAMHSRTASAKPAPWHSGGGPEAPALVTQRLIGNQAALRMLVQRPASPDAPKATPVAEPVLNEAPMADRSRPCCSQCASVGAVHTKLVVGAVDDPLEHEADRIADQVMRMPESAPPAISSGAAAVNRACAACEEEEEHGRDQSVRAKPADRADVSGHSFAPPAVYDALASPGQPIDPAGRAWAEQRLGRDLADVRIHTGAAADRGARAIGARAFTVGRDIAFASGEYAPATPAGQRLLLHELVHVAQQGSAQRVVQRACTHDGTPVNCHNWKLPLPPWLAGTFAHMQITDWAGIPWHSIPRAAKSRLGLPSLPTTPWGYADLWQRAATLNIGEIKSTAVGSAIGTAEALHYVKRHDESVLRGPIAADDMAYLSEAGTRTGTLLDLSGRTGTGIAIGPFVADPLKTLYAEADKFGAVVYWCTGVGAVNPLWLKLFKDATDELKKKLAKLKRMMADILDGVTEGMHAFAKWIGDVVGDIVEWGEKNSRALAIAALLVIVLVALVAAVLSALAEPPSAGTSTVPLIASVATLATAAAGIMLLLGFSSPTLKDAAVTTASALHPAEADAAVSASDYDPVGDTKPMSMAAASAAKPADQGMQLIAALKPFADPDAIAKAAVVMFKGDTNNADGLAALKSGVKALRAGGDDASAAAIEKQMTATGLV